MIFLSIFMPLYTIYQLYRISIYFKLPKLGVLFNFRYGYHMKFFFSRSLFTHNTNFWPPNMTFLSIFMPLCTIHQLYRISNCLKLLQLGVIFNFRYDYHMKFFIFGFFLSTIRVFNPHIWFFEYFYALMDDLWAI